MEQVCLKTLSANMDMALWWICAFEKFVSCLLIIECRSFSFSYWEMQTERCDLLFSLLIEYWGGPC